MGQTNNPCTLCGQPGIPGLLRGAGKCQYHYNLGQFGQRAADLAKASAELAELAQEDAFKADAHGVDLNPFSTPGARHTWQQGWQGVRPGLLTDGSVQWRYWERGRHARRIADKRGAKAPV